MFAHALPLLVHPMLVPSARAVPKWTVTALGSVDGQTLETWPNKSQIPTENPGKPGKNPDLGSGGVCAVIFIVSLKKSVARKLRSIILLHSY